MRGKPEDKSFQKEISRGKKFIPECWVGGYTVPVRITIALWLVPREEYDIFPLDSEEIDI